MPLRDDLLHPIPGENPSGADLRYDALYDRIKEARREDDIGPQGDWQHTRKVADHALVIKLCSEALATKTKDLQLAAWLTASLLRREGYSGLRQGLDLVRHLLENFWDTVYPELEDGDAEFRASPLEWMGSTLQDFVKMVPLTRSGLDWTRYRESRTVGYEEQAQESESRAEARRTALAEGKIPAEEWDAAFDATPKTFYSQLEQTIDATLESLDALNEKGEELFGEVAPGFRHLRSAIEEVRTTVHILLEKKREIEPDAEPETAAEHEEEPADELATATEEVAAPAAQPASRGRPAAATPADREDAVGRVIAAAAYLRRQEPANPMSYLVLRGLRWGELRAGGGYVDPRLLEPPPTEIRTRLKSLALDGQWEEVLETAETAMGMPCGRGWLDLQRYAVRACQELGGDYATVAGAILSELKALLADFSDLTQMTLMDDTATANSETQAWLRAEVTSAEPEPAVAQGSWTEEQETPESESDVQQLEATPPMDDQEPGTLTPDPFALAIEAVREGRRDEAVAILQRELAQERSGRGRFQRRMQLAKVLMSAGRDSIAFPILEDLAAEIDLRKLEEWEKGEVVAHPLVLLLQCQDKLEGDAGKRRALYNRICRLDPVQALSCGG